VEVALELEWVQVVDESSPVPELVLVLLLVVEAVVPELVHHLLLGRFVVLVLGKWRKTGKQHRIVVQTQHQLKRQLVELQAEPRVGLQVELQSEPKVGMRAVQLVERKAGQQVQLDRIDEQFQRQAIG